MRKQLVVGFLLFGVTAVIGCGSPEIAQREPTTASADSDNSDEDNAAETINRMLEVAKSGDWEAYVDDYYGEQRKFRSPADRDALVKRFEEKWGEELVQGLGHAARLPVQIDGDKAIFLDGDDTMFILYRSQSGGWKFHL